MKTHTITQIGAGEWFGLSSGHICPSCGGRYFAPTSDPAVAAPHRRYGICFLCYRGYTDDELRRAVWLTTPPPALRVVVLTRVASIEFPGCTADLFKAGTLTITRQVGGRVEHTFDTEDWLHVDVFDKDGHPIFWFDNPALDAQVPHHVIA